MDLVTKALFTITNQRKNKRKRRSNLLQKNGWHRVNPRKSDHQIECGERKLVDHFKNRTIGFIYKNDSPRKRTTEMIYHSRIDRSVSEINSNPSELWASLSHTRRSKLSLSVLSFSSQTKHTVSQRLLAARKEREEATPQKLGQPVLKKRVFIEASKSPKEGRIQPSLPAFLDMLGRVETQLSKQVGMHHSLYKGHVQCYLPTFGVFQGVVQNLQLEHHCRH
ncbi:hypothetical protein M9H77_34907 [Catharanthus roseus]|uniref:Uncharacterized protein n=1 Tax=Catharanthus roseus TaxID=4058 RepID=A0ACB9ZRR4_CATRO|nr:hypothetical protein M9H77_34907 [Catharanthus roseus]